MISFHLHNNAMRWKNCYYPHFTGNKAKAPERFSSLPKATQLARDRARL